MASLATMRPGAPISLPPVRSPLKSGSREVIARTRAPASNTGTATGPARALDGLTKSRAQAASPISQAFQNLVQAMAARIGGGKPTNPGTAGRANALSHVPATAPAWGLRAKAAGQSVPAFKAANPQLRPGSAPPGSTAPPPSVAPPPVSPPPVDPFTGLPFPAVRLSPTPMSLFGPY